MSPLCILRAIVWSVQARAPVCGHAWIEQTPEKGQPQCVHIMRCEACRTISMSWRECAQCGAPGVQ